MKIHIGAVAVDVVHVDLPPRKEGYFDPNFLIIGVSRSIPWGSDLWCETVWHEAQHAYYHLSGYREPAHLAIAGLAMVVKDNLQRVEEEMS